MEAAPAGLGLPGGGHRVCRGQGFLAGRPAEGCHGAHVLFWMLQVTPSVLCASTLRAQRSLGQTPWLISYQSERLRDLQANKYKDDLDLKGMMDTLDEISGGNCNGHHRLSDKSLRDFLSVDAPLNGKNGVSFVGDRLPDILKRFQSNSGRCKIYEHVGPLLVDFYQDLYTKKPIREWLVGMSYALIKECICPVCQEGWLVCLVCCCCASFCSIAISPLVLLELFQYVSTPIALVLFWAAEKGGKQTQYPTRADIIVSYLLLLGATVLDVSSATISIFSMYSQKQWSEEIAQYNMMKRLDGIHTPVDWAMLGCLGCRVT